MTQECRNIILTKILS